MTKVTRESLEQYVEALERECSQLREALRTLGWTDTDLSNLMLGVERAPKARAKR